MIRLVPLVLLAGCYVTETGNPEFDASIAMRATSSNTDAVDVNAPDGTLSVDQAWVSIDRIRLVRGDVCDGPGEEEIDVPGTYIADTAALVPDVITARVPEDSYCRIRLRMEPAADIGNAPAELRDHVLLIRGVREDGVPWQLRSTEDIDLDVRATMPLSLSEATASVVVAFDVAGWLEGVDLNSATVGGDGSITIEEGSNEDLLERFEDNLEDAVELLDDDDDDDDDDDLN